MFKVEGLGLGFRVRVLKGRGGVNIGALIGLYLRIMWDCHRDALPRSPSLKYRQV